MPVMDPFEGAKSENQEQSKALLEVIAQSGAAGKKAYQDAQQQAQTQRQGALDWASKRAQLTGNNFGGVDLNPVTEAADRYGTYFAGQDAANQAQLGQIGSSANSYLAKVNAIQPFIQSENMNKAQERENQYKTAIAQAQAQIDAQKRQREQEHQWDLEKMAIANRYNVESDNRSQRAAGAKAAADRAENITLPQLVGLARQTPGIFNDTQNILGQTAEGTRAGIAGANLAQRAGQLGTQAGMSQTKLAGLTEPGFLSGLNKDLVNLLPGGGLPLPPALSKDWITSNVIMPGTNKLATTSRADDVLKAPEIGMATEFLNDLSQAKVERGRLNDKLFGEDFVGMSPKDAFNAYVDSLPGILTMKAALKQYYAPYLDQLGAR